MNGRWVHGNSVALSDQVLLALGIAEPSVFLYVSHHKHTTGKAKGFLAYTLWKYTEKSYVSGIVGGIIFQYTGSSEGVIHNL